MRSKIAAILDSTSVASIMVAVAEDGRIVWEEGFGWANREEGLTYVHICGFAVF